MKKLIMFLLISTLLFSKDINVGDLIQIKIEGVERENIYEAFSNSPLQVEKIEKLDNGYLVALRSFEIGEKSVDIGNKKLIFNVKSVLDEKDKEIYPHLSDNSDTILYSQKFPYQLILGGVLGISSLFYLLRGIKLSKKANRISPEDRFERKISQLGENWDFQLSMAIREYIDSIYESHFVNGEYIPIGKIDAEDIKFIEKLDRYKFSKENIEFKENILEKVKEIYQRVRGDKKDV